MSCIDVDVVDVKVQFSTSEVSVTKIVMLPYQLTSSLVSDVRHDAECFTCVFVGNKEAVSSMQHDHIGI